jgi:hypothetical protein
MNLDPSLWPRRAPKLVLVGALGVSALALSECGSPEQNFSHCVDTPRVEATPSTSDINYDPSTDPQTLEEFDHNEGISTSGNGYGGTTCISDGKLWLTVRGDQAHTKYLEAQHDNSANG